jgi:hypothetical protein
MLPNCRGRVRHARHNHLNDFASLSMYICSAIGGEFVYGYSAAFTVGAYIIILPAVAREVLVSSRY